MISFFSPPNIKSDFPNLASTDVRPIGQSIIETLLSFNFDLISSVSRGWIVDISITIALFFKVSTAPFLSNKTCFTCSEFGNIVKRKSQSIAASEGELAAIPSLATWSFISFSLISKPFTSCPPFIIFAAIGPPIVPSPIKPIFVILYPSQITKFCLSKHIYKESSSLS